MFSINREIGIERQDEMSIIVFRHADDARVGQRHRNVSIFVKQLAQFHDMLVDPKRDVERAIFDERQHGVLCLVKAREQEHRLREHRLTDEKRRVELLDALSDPAVVTFRSIEKGDQRSGVNDGCGHCGRSLRSAWDLKRGRSFPNRSSHARASSGQQGWVAGASRAELPGPAANLPRSDPSACGRAAPLQPWLVGTNRRGPRRWSSFSYPDDNKSVKPYLCPQWGKFKSLR